MNNKALWAVIIAIILAAGAGYYFGFDIGFEKAVAPTMQQESNTNSQILAQEPQHEVRGSAEAYYNDVEGFYARPADDEQYPGVVMIHEWWGLNDNIRAMAKQLAGQGYQVLAVDLYNGSVAADATEARALVTGLDQQEAQRNMQAAIAYLRSDGASRIASLGWCFGGGQSMQLALSGEQLDATVIYYGNLVTDEAQLAAVDWPVLGVFGSEDTSIPVATVNEFDAALDNLGIQNEVYIYEGVGHAFANPSGANYAPQETMDAWSKTLSFLENALKTQ